MTDRYTRTILTIIGMALLALVFQTGIQRATAQFSCGASPDNPCYMRVHLDCGGAVCAVKVDR